MRQLGILVLIGLASFLTGCIGSPEGYHPGYDPRPEEITLESAEDRAKRLAVPLHIVRNGAYYEVGRREIARVLGGVPHNLWYSYEVDFDDVLGIDDRLKINVAETYLNRPQYYLDARAKAKALAEGRPQKKPEPADDEDEDMDEDDEDMDEDEDE